MRVLDQAQQQGTVPTGSMLSPGGAYGTFAWTGSLRLNQPDYQDPNLTIVVSMRRTLGDGGWDPHPCQVWEWTGAATRNEPPSFTWTGFARRVRLDLDIVRAVGPATVAVGADLNVNQAP